MKRQFVFGTVIAAAFAVGASAQQSSSQSQQERERSGTGAEQQKVVVTGCLKSGDTMTGATGATPGTATTGTGARAEGQFVLTNAKVSSGATAKTQPGAQTGTAGTTGTTAAADSYRLIAGGQQNLKEHQNHQVEITGVLQGQAGERGREDKPGAEPRTGTAAGRAEDEKMPTLRVTSLRHISGTCSESR